ncbi:MAG: septum formation initiator family protein [Dehalococcoidia bacterium]|nr:septum formation initiator family protein [Thermoflexaceae bacterium]MCK6563826.1 septum formation initiator family protein [Dehalococcoidia bacterium]NUQ54403.1 septum formation initiator family protein [Dehalococcoidia bacterium]
MSRSRLVFLACLVIAGYFLYTAALGALRAHQLGDDRKQAEREVTVLEEKKKYLEAVRDYVASDAYVEQEARRQLGYVRDGEVPFVVISPPLDEGSRPAGEWWQRLFPR